MNSLHCKVCGSSNVEVFYNGPIRLGTFGQFSASAHNVYKCQSCKSKFLPSTIEDISEYYQSSKYREDVNGDSLVATYHSIHDREQVKNLNITGLDTYRNKVVADIGCGGGSFLDSVSGISKTQVAIEPSGEYRDYLISQGYKTFPYTNDALVDYAGGVDVSVSFSVIEHIEDPLTFLGGIYSLLKTGGKIILSTPNARDALLDMLPEDYGRFFYRKVHLWYFDAESLTKVLELAGFKNVKIIPHQRFGLGNFLDWVKDKKPQGTIDYAFISEALNINWKYELERNFQCDYLFAIASKE